MHNTSAYSATIYFILFFYHFLILAGKPGRVTSVQLANAQGRLPSGACQPFPDFRSEDPTDQRWFHLPPSLLTGILVHCVLSSTRCQFPRTWDSVFGESETVELNSIQSHSLCICPLCPTMAADPPAWFKFSSLQPSLSPHAQGTWPMSWQEHIHRHPNSLPPQPHTIIVCCPPAAHYSPESRNYALISGLPCTGKT